MNIKHNSHSFCRVYFAHDITSQENRWLKNAILSWFTQIVSQWKHKTMKAVWGRHSTQNRALPGNEQITFLFVFLQLFQLCSEAEAPVTRAALSLFPFGQKTNKSHTQKPNLKQDDICTAAQQKLSDCPKGFGWWRVQSKDCHQLLVLNSCPETHTTLDVFQEGPPTLPGKIQNSISSVQWSRSEASLLKFQPSTLQEDQTTN